MESQIREIHVQRLALVERIRGDATSGEYLSYISQIKIKTIMSQDLFCGNRIVPDKSGSLNRSTQHSLELYSWQFQRLNSFTRVDSNKTLPCLGLTEYGPIERFAVGCTVGSAD
jgi:hypothetical protein